MRAWCLALLLATLAVLLLPKLAEADCVPRVRDVPADSDAWRYEPIARGVGRDMDVPSDLILRTIHVESRGDPDAVSYAGALGLMQIHEMWWQAGEPWWDPYVNIRKGSWMLRQVWERTGSWVEAARRYFGGSGDGYTSLIFRWECR